MINGSKMAARSPDIFGNIVLFWPGIFDPPPEVAVNFHENQAIDQNLPHIPPDSVFFCD